MVLILHLKFSLDLWKPQDVSFLPPTNPFSWMFLSQRVHIYSCWLLALFQSTGTSRFSGKYSLARLVCSYMTQTRDILSSVWLPSSPQDTCLICPVNAGSSNYTRIYRFLFQSAIKVASKTVIHS